MVSRYSSPACVVVKARVISTVLLEVCSRKAEIRCTASVLTAEFVISLASHVSVCVMSKHEVDIPAG